MSKYTIFVSIASYRDFELIQTIKSCIDNVSSDAFLTFGICNQFDENTKYLNEFKEIQSKYNNIKLKVSGIPWEGIKGVGHARKIANELYVKSDYYLQIDSHMLFSKNWDKQLISDFEYCKTTYTSTPKPLLTGYPAAYLYKNGEIVQHTNKLSNVLVIKGWDYKHIPTFRSSNVDSYYEVLRGSFIAGGFIFTIGDFATEVLYDEEVYFTGEEILTSIKSFNKGYRVFHPTKWCVWHHYGDRAISDDKKARRVWQDTPEDEKLKKLRSNNYSNSIKWISNWIQNNEISAFEKHAAISFIHQLVHPEALRLGCYWVNNKDWVEEYYPIKNYVCDLAIYVKDINRDNFKYGVITMFNITGAITHQFRCDKYEQLDNIEFQSRNGLGKIQLYIMKQGVDTWEPLIEIKHVNYKEI